MFLTQKLAFIYIKLKKIVVKNTYTKLTILTILSVCSVLLNIFTLMCNKALEFFHFSKLKLYTHSFPSPCSPWQPPYLLFLFFFNSN